MAEAAEMSARPQRTLKDKPRGGETAPAAPELTATLAQSMSAEVLTQISGAVSAALDERLIKLQAGMDEIKHGLEAQARRMDTAEAILSDHGDRLAQLEDQVAVLQTQNKRLGDLADDYENRSRRNNIRMIGLPEGVLDAELPSIYEQWLPRELGLEGRNMTVVCERVHRMGAPRENNGKPRPVIGRILNWAHKAQLMQEYRKKGSLVYKGQKILLFNDYSQHVVALRKEMSSVCTTLHQKGVRFSLIYPAKLRVVHGGQAKVFTEKAAALRFLREIGAAE